MMNIGLPKDPYMLLSLVNMRLRDQYTSLEDFCRSLDVNEVDIKSKLEEIGYEYSKKSNQFVSA